MAYVPVPKDLSKVKTKVALNLTKRQLICFGIAAAVGFSLFFSLRGIIGTNGAAFIMVVVMLPCFMFGMYEKHGQPFEKVLKNIITVNFIRPKKRPYKTTNFYDVVMRQTKLNKEVLIIAGKKENKINGSRKKANSGRYRESQRE